MTFPIGSTVKWKDRYYKDGWRGKVTGHPMARMVEVNGQGAISVGLLELVEMDMDDLTPPHWTGETIDQLKSERYELAYAITGGEDAPGLLDSVPVAQLVEIAKSQHRQHSQQIDENMALNELVAQQCELIGQLQPDASEFKRLQELEDGFSVLQDRVSDMLMALVGSRTPTRETCKNWPPELYALAEELANYGG